MKANCEQEVDDKQPETPAVAGDVIGNTAYSERFVLKILIKFANLDTLKDEVQYKSFEEDLCTLWDMTAETDVVHFLLKHNILNLFQFALPTIESPRLTEIVMGIIANMACQKEVVESLLKMDVFLPILLEFIKTDDSLVLIQVLRLVNSALYLTSKEKVDIWMELFEKIDYPKALLFIIKNSSHKNLLVNSLENFNTICTYCNVEKYRTKFFTQFVTAEALMALSAAFTEVTVVQMRKCDREELERVFVINLQIILNLVGFDKSLEIYSDCKELVMAMIEVTINYYERKLVTQREMDTDLVDVIESTNIICNVLELCQACNTDVFFEPSYNMWKALQLVKTTEQNGSSNFEDEDKEELRDFTKDIESPLSSLICQYINKCSEANLQKVLEDVDKDFESIMSQVNDKNLQEAVEKRTAIHRSRIKDNVDS